MADEFEIYENFDILSENYIAMNEMRRDGIQCDVVFKVEHDSFSAHSNVLHVSSELFRRLFSIEIFRAGNHIREIPIYNIQSSTVEMILDYMYNGIIEINKENVEKLMFGFDYFEIFDVRDRCVKFLTKTLKEQFKTRQDVRSFFDLWKIREKAHFMEKTRLMAVVDNLIGCNLKEMMISKEFLELNVNQLFDLIGSNHIFTETEEIIFEAVMNWIKFLKVERIHLLPDVFANVRLNLLSRKYLTEKVCEDRLIKESEVCQNRIYHHLNEGEEGPLENSRSRFHEQAKKIYVCGGTLNKGSMEKYDPALEEWSNVGNIPSGRTDMGGAILNDKIYILGGHTDRNSDHVSMVEVFNTKTNAWHECCEMPVRKSFPAVAVKENRIYVCGGCNDNGKLNSVECYRPSFDNWLTISPMREQRMASVAVTLNGFIYVMGGYDCDDQALNSVERFYHEEDTWQTIKPMLMKRGSFGAAVMDGKIYVCGGDNGEETFADVEVYDPGQDTWELITPMNSKRTSLAVVANMGKIWAIGGISELRDGDEDDYDAFDTVEVFDPDTGNWVFDCSMNVIRDNHVAGVIP